MIAEGLRQLQAYIQAAGKPEVVKSPNGNGSHFIQWADGKRETVWPYEPFTANVATPSDLVSAWKTFADSKTDAEDFPSYSASMWASQTLFSIRLFGENADTNDTIEFRPMTNDAFQVLDGWSKGQPGCNPETFVDYLRDEVDAPESLIGAVRRIKWRRIQEGQNVTENADRFVSSSVRTAATLGEDGQQLMGLLEDSIPIGGIVFDNLESPFALRCRLKLDLNRQLLSLKARRRDVIALVDETIRHAAMEVHAALTKQGIIVPGLIMGSTT